MQEKKQDHKFLCSQCGAVYSSMKKNAVCPRCHKRNKPYQVKTLYCPYCGSPAYLKHRSEVFTPEQLESAVGRGMKSEHLYICKNFPECNALVWTHPGTLIPYGHLADAALRKKRIFAHDCIQSMMQLHIMSQNRVYYWLSSCLGYRRKDTHISQMSDTMCEEVIELTLNAVKNRNITEYQRLLKRRRWLEESIGR